MNTHHTVEFSVSGVSLEEMEQQALKVLQRFDGSAPDRWTIDAREASRAVGSTVPSFFCGECRAEWTR